MVRCAICESAATSSCFVSNYGILSTCAFHNDVLRNYEIVTKKLKNNKMRDILKKIIMDLNQKLAKVPLDKTPGQTQYNRGMRVAFKLSVDPIERELERLIRE